MSYARSGLGQHQPFHPGRQLGASLGASFLGPAKEMHSGQVLTASIGRPGAMAGYPAGSPSPAHLPIVAGAVRGYVQTGAVTAGAVTGHGFVAGDAAGIATTAGVVFGVNASGGTAAGQATTTAAIRGYGYVAAALEIGFQPSAEDIAQAVWGQQASVFTDPASFGALAQLLLRLARNKVVTDPVAGTYTVYADDGTTVLLSAPLFEDVAGTQGYRGQGADRRDRFT